MRKRPKVTGALRDAHLVRTVWESIPDFKLGDLTLEGYAVLHDNADQLTKAYSAKDNELTGIRAQRDEAARLIEDLVTRFRSAMRGMYGSESAQYERAGGTPQSFRQRSRRAATPKAPAAPEA